MEKGERVHVRESSRVVRQAWRKTGVIEDVKLFNGDAKAKAFVVFDDSVNAPWPVKGLWLPLEVR